MKSFSKKTKEVICKLKTQELCCCEAELLGLLMFAGKFKGEEIRVSLESLETIKRFRDLLKKCFDVDAEIKSLKNSYFCTLSDRKILGKIIEYETSKEAFFKSFEERECCMNSFLRGAFLGGGSLTDPNKNYNMEFLTYSEKIRDEFGLFLQKLGLGFRSLSKKSGFVLYTKNSDIICDALAHMGAFSSQMEILNVKIEREVRSDITRVSNGETANMDRVIEASSRHLSAVEKIEKTIGIDNLSDELREVAVLRRDYKDLSLEQLGRKMTPPLSKSGVNHRLKKLLEIADNL